MSDLTPEEQKRLLSQISVGCSIVSFLSSFFIIACYLKFKDIRTFAFDLVVWLSLCDLLASSGKMIGVAGELGSEVCILQASVTATFELASVLWSAAIAFLLHMAFLKERPSFSPSQVVNHKVKFHIVVWGFTIVLSILPAITKSYGDIGEWCWITAHRPIDIACRYVQFYAPLWMTLLYCMFVYIRVRIKMKALDYWNSKVRRIMYYPLVMVLSWTFGSVGVLKRHVGWNMQDTLWLRIVVAVTSGLFGFFNAVVYGMTPNVRDRIKVALGYSLPDSYVTLGSADNTRTDVVSSYSEPSSYLSPGSNY